MSGWPQADAERQEDEADELQELRDDAGRMQEALAYIGSTPCECQKNLARMYQHPWKPRAVCVSCLAKVALEPAPHRAKEGQE